MWLKQHKTIPKITIFTGGKDHSQMDGLILFQSLLGISYPTDLCFGGVQKIPNYWDINPNINPNPFTLNIPKIPNSRDINPFTSIPIDPQTHQTDKHHRDHPLGLDD